MEHFVWSVGNIAVIVAFVVVLAGLYYLGYKDRMKEILFYLVTKAEAEFGGGTGQIKYSAVVTWIYERIPSIVKFFLTEKELDRLIEAAVEEMKKYLENNEKAKKVIMK